MWSRSADVLDFLSLVAVFFFDCADLAVVDHANYLHVLPLLFIPNKLLLLLQAKENTSLGLHVPIFSVNALQ